MASVGTVVIELDANTAKLIEGTKRAEKHINSFQSQINIAKQNIADFAKAAVGIYAVSQAFDMIKSSAASFIDTAAQFEKYGATLKSLEGDAATAQRSMDWIKEFSATTPFQLGEVTDAFIKMRGYGLDPTHGMLTTLGDTASAMGKQVGQAVEAMADAVNGSNERLLEFGVKASKSGEKISDAWTDSSGKMRNIVIANNKEVIASTLSAIWNEKYAGAMAEQAKTWYGTISNLKDRWTNFQNELMSEGLFTYLKAMANTVGDMMSVAFGGAKNSAKGFSLFVIEGIKEIIRSVGWMADQWNVVTATWAAVEIAFLGVVVIVEEGVNRMAVGWDAFTVGAHNAFKAFIDAVGTSWVATVNFMLDKINIFLSALAGLGNNVLGLLGMEGIKPLSFELGVYTSAIKTATQDTTDLINTDWENSKLNESIKKIEESVVSFSNEGGAEAAAKTIEAIDKNIAKVTQSEIKNNKVREDAAAYLLKNGALYGDLAESTKKAGDAAKKTHTDAAKAASKQAKEVAALIKSYDEDALNFFLDANDAAKSAEEVSQQYADSFSSAFEGILGGDVFSAFESFFNNISTQLVKPFIDQISAKLSSMLSSMIGGLGTFGSALLGVGLAAAVSVISKLTTSRVSESALKSAQGVTTVLSDTINKSIETITKNSTLGLDYSEKMVASLRTLVVLTNKAASNIGSDITGADYVDSTDYGFFNDTSKELVSVGIKLNPASITQLNAGQLTASKYMTEKITESGFLGIGAGESLKTTQLGAADASITAPINAAYLEGIDALSVAAQALGESSDQFAADAASWTTSLNQLNFAGKTQEEIAEMINGAISADLDKLAESLSAAAPYLTQYAQAGEGQAETLIRLANELEVVTRELGYMGIALPPVADGGLAVADAMVKASGGMDKFLANMDAFISGFYTESEQAAMMGQDLTKSLAEIGLALPATAYGFRVMIESLAAAAQTGTEVAIAAYTTALALSADAAKYYSAIGSSVTSTGVAATSCAAAASSCASAASDAEDAAETLANSVASLTAEWIGGLDGALLMLQTIQEATGIVGVTYENFLDMFKAASASSTFTQEDYDQWSQLSAALIDVNNETLQIAEEKLALEVKGLEEQVSFYEEIINKISEAYTGSLSYLNSMEKAAYAAQQAQLAISSGDTQSYFDYLGAQLEAEKAMSVTKEDYAIKFDEYIRELQAAEPEATTDDVVDELEELNKKIDELTYAIEKASYK